MKIFPVVVFFLISLFSIQLSFAQDSSNTNLPVRDTSVYSKSAPRKTFRHKHPIKDSVGIGSSLQDTTIHSRLFAKKPVKRKHIFTDSTDSKSFNLQDSIDQNLFLALNPYVHPITLKKSVRHKISISDSVALSDSLKYGLLFAPMSESEIAALWESIVIRDSLKLIADSLYTDSIYRHWEGWKKYQIQTGHSYTLYSKRVLKGKSKSELEYNIADFYLYLNGQMVVPPKSAYFFFAAGCLCFKYDDTLLLNSGLGFKVGVGVGIKIIDGRFTSSLHANKHNTEVYKFSKNDTDYVKSVMASPLTQSLKLKNQPAYASNEIIIGEYRATYKKFYEKNEDDQDEVRQYTVRIIFRCRVTGGIDSIKSLSGTNSK